MISEHYVYRDFATDDVDLNTLGKTETVAMLKAITKRTDGTTDISDELVKLFFDALFKEKGTIVKIRLTCELVPHDT